MTDNKRKVNFIQFSIQTAIMLGAFAVCTAVSYLLDYLHVKDLNFLIIYILGILVTAIFTRGFVYSILLSILSVFGYNFFFTVPRFTFHFDDRSYLATFLLMAIVGVVVSAITYQLKRKMAQINALNMEKIKLKSEAEKEQLKATLLRSISHDLRTPLTTMKNGAEVLLTENSIEQADRREILENISSKADWTIRLVENLLSLSRIDSEKLTVKKAPEALEEIIPQAVRTVQGALGHREVTYDMPPELLLVPMDATLIIQTIGNILGNAIKHTADDGKIHIKVWNAGKHAVFRISNDGQAIRNEDLPHIFEAYYKGGGDSAGESGIGLGLSICKLIVTAHGGKISARNLERGVVFEFTLPMEDENG
jgi:hypothetical protein